MQAGSLESFAGFGFVHVANNVLRVASGPHFPSVFAKPFAGYRISDSAANQFSFPGAVGISAKLRDGNGCLRVNLFLAQSLEVFRVSQLAGDCPVAGDSVGFNG